MIYKYNPMASSNNSVQALLHRGSYFKCEKLESEEKSCQAIGKEG